MPTTTVIGSVTTEDAAPTVAPNKISRDSGHTTATVVFTPTHDGQIVPSDDLLPSDTLTPGAVRDIIGWELREGGSDQSTGKVIAHYGNRCSPTRACGTRALLNDQASSVGVRSTSGQAISVAFTFSDADDGGADGARTVNVYVLTESQGWS